MGGRDVGYMSHPLPGQRLDRQRRAPPADGAVLGPAAGHDPPARRATTRSRMFDALERGEIKAIWIIGTNPAASMPNLPTVRAALEKRRTGHRAGRVLPDRDDRVRRTCCCPAAVNLEQAGTFCNSERRVTLMEQVVAAARRRQAGLVVGAAGRAGDGLRAGDALRRRPPTIFDEFARMHRRPAQRPERAVPRAAPRARARSSGRTRRWASRRPAATTDGQFPTPSGRARFCAPRRCAAGRAARRASSRSCSPPAASLNQWHTRTKTGLVAAAEQARPRPVPPDAPRRRRRAAACTTAQRVEVAQPPRHGRRRRCASTTRHRPASVFMPIHWNDLWAAAASPNEATTDAADPISKQPSLKGCAVSVSARLLTSE